MNFQLYSYRFSKEILEHDLYRNAHKEIFDIITECPLFIFPNKSITNSRLDTVQQLLNTFFDRRFACDNNWSYHPNATNIPNSGLAADYRKSFEGLRIQTEVQFGNMSRWYSDIFKFQTAYSQDMIDIGLSIVPKSSLANRIDSNIANFERCARELPSAKLSITLPILLVGIDVGDATKIVNVADSGFAQSIGTFTRAGNVANRYRLINGFLEGTLISDINENSETGPFASLVDTND